MKVSVVDWPNLPSTFLTRTVGALTSEVIAFEKAVRKTLASLPNSPDIPAEVLVCAALLSVGDDAKRAELHTWCPDLPAEFSSDFENLVTSIIRNVPEHLISELVPYLMEPVVGGYRLPFADGGGQGRQARQKLGTFYTPGDVANFMVREGLGRVHGEQFPILDPCCGTGVFLREYVRQTRGVLEPEKQLRAITGIDLDPRSLNIAAMVLSQEIFGSLGDWRRVRDQLLFGDALELIKEARHRNKYRLLVANPPYGSSDTSPDRAADFTNLLLDALTADGVGVMIIPASIATSRTGPQSRARSVMLATASTWTFLNFDRSPDSLFGDDVKQRCTVIVRECGGPHEVWTSPMLRWRRRARHAVLMHRDAVRLNRVQMNVPVPRVGSALELQVFDAILKVPRRQLRTRRLDLGQLLALNEVVVGDVAYNFVPADFGPDSPFAGPGRRAYAMRSDEEALALYAVLVSRLGFWFWRAFDDGFHVSVEYVTRLAGAVQLLEPSTRQVVAHAGVLLRAGGERNLVRSMNAGKSGITPVPLAGSAQMSEVETIILEALGLPSRAVERFLIELETVHEVADVWPNNTRGFNE